MYSGPVDQMNASFGFFELKAADPERLYSLAGARILPLESWFKKGKLLTAFLTEPMEPETLNTYLFEKGLVLSQLVKRKESLEEQFLQLTNQISA